MRHLFAILILISIAAIIGPAFTTAGTVEWRYEVISKLPPAGGIQPGDIRDVATLVRYAFLLGLGLSGILAFGMIVFAGLEWALSGANPSLQEDAKDRIRNAIFGLLLLMGAYVILNTINPDLVSLRNPQGWTLPVVIEPPPPPPPLQCPSANPTDYTCGAPAGCPPGYVPTNENCPSTEAGASCIKQDYVWCVRQGAGTGTGNYGCSAVIGTGYVCNQRYESLTACQNSGTCNLPRGNCVPLDQCLSTASCPKNILPWSGQEPFSVDWSNTSPGLQTAAEEFVKRVRSAVVGGQAIITSAWRPQEYQAHIRSAWEAWKLTVARESLTKSCSYLNNKLQPPPAGTCDAISKEAAREVNKVHHIVKSGAACNSNHTDGTAVDISWTNITTQAVRDIAKDVGLCHPYDFDRPHFVLKTAHPSCVDNY